MSRRRIPVRLCALCLLLCAGAAAGEAAGEPVHDNRALPQSTQREGGSDSSPSSAFSFACYLFAEGHWDQAATEFQRFRFFSPDDRRVPEAMLGVGICCERMDRYADAIVSYRTLTERFPDTSEGDEARYRIGAAYYRAGKFEEARIALHESFDKAPLSPWYWKARYRIAWASLRLHAFAVAEERFQDLASRDNPYREKAGQITMTLESVKDLPYRSPVLAGVLSAVLPGAGQLYAGAWKDALLSLLVNGALIAGTYEAVDKEVYGVGGVVGVVGLGFYAGNIYGAVNTAHHFNREELTVRLNALEKQYEWAGETEAPDACPLAPVTTVH